MNTTVRIRVATGLLAAGLLVATSLLFIKSAFAAAGSMYVSPSSASVQNGNNVTVNVRITPGTDTDAVSVRLNYDSTKLTYVSSSYAGSPYTTQVGASATSSTVSVDAAILGSTVSTDSQIMAVTFTAKVGSGTSSLTLTGSNAAYSGTATNPSLASGTITFTSPATPTCPAGQTGTYPNCVTPTQPSNPSTPSNPSKPSTPASTGSNSGSSAGTSATNSQQVTKPSGTDPASVTNTQIQYTTATLNFATKNPTQVYIRYGLDGQLTLTTKADDFNTTHAVKLDATSLEPGHTYSYVVVSTDKQGVVSTTETKEFSTKGLNIQVAILDKNKKPIEGKQVTLHSDPQTVKTNAKGVASYTNVATGSHEVQYVSGGKTYKQQIQVLNNVQTTGDTQTAATQNFSVIYPVTVSSVSMVTIFMAVAGVVVLAVAGVWGFKRFGPGPRFGNGAGDPLIAQSVVVGGNTPPTSQNTPTPGPDLSASLNAIPSPSQPTPGSSVDPQGGSWPPSGTRPEGF